ncbi:MAG TPA: hypothetical protein PK402_11480, partial [Tepidisphaeraceae bacterium]|nr:hypothetical protein [Tepidisphaeraceae bacterium]
MFHLLSVALIFLMASIARADLPNGLKFDDGFTWIECQPFETVEDNVLTTRWVPKMNLRIFGAEVPGRSGWKVVVKKDGKPLGEYVNDGFPFQLGATKGMTIVGWWKETPKLDVDGLLDFDVYYIDGATDQEHLAKTLKVDVRKVTTCNGSVGQRDAGYPAFYVNRHAEVLSSIVYFRDVEWYSYTGMPDITYYSDRTIELLLNYSENENFDGPAIGRIKLEVNGNPVDFKLPDNDVIQDELSRGQQAGKYNVAHSDRNAKKYLESGPAYKERVGFAWRSLVLPIHWGPKPEHRRPDKIFANDYPGDWKITWLIDRKPVRVWTFKVGADGLPIPHPEQAAGLNL